MKHLKSYENKKDYITIEGQKYYIGDYIYTKMIHPNGFIKYYYTAKIIKFLENHLFSIKILNDKNEHYYIKPTNIIRLSTNTEIEKFLLKTTANKYNL